MFVHRLNKCLVVVAFVTLPAAASPEFTTGEPASVVVEAKVEAVQSLDGIIRVGLYGTYKQRKLQPKFSIEFDQRELCRSTNKSSCSQTSYSYSYNEISEFIVALERIVPALKASNSLVVTFKMCGLACETEPDYSELRLAKGSRSVFLTIQQTRGTKYTMRLDEKAVSALLLQLKRVQDIQQYLKPQFDAFNATLPNTSVDVDLEVHLPQR